MTVLLLDVYTQIHLLLLSFHEHFKLHLLLCTVKIFMVLDCVFFLCYILCLSRRNGTHFTIFYNFSWESIFVCCKYAFFIFKEMLITFQDAYSTTRWALEAIQQRAACQWIPGGEPVRWLRSWRCERVSSLMQCVASESLGGTVNLAFKLLKVTLPLWIGTQSYYFIVQVFTDFLDAPNFYQVLYFFPVEKLADFCHQIH